MEHEQGSDMTVSWKRWYTQKEMKSFCSSGSEKHFWDENRGGVFPKIIFFLENIF